MVMDADSTINPEFLDRALGLLEEEADLMAVGGLFFGEPGGGLIGQLQRNEYGRYQRQVARKLNRVFVLTDPPHDPCPRAPAPSRSHRDPIPGAGGKVYDTLGDDRGQRAHPLLKTLGARSRPRDCRVTTEVTDDLAISVATGLLAPRGAGEHLRVHAGDRDDRERSAWTASPRCGPSCCSPPARRGTGIRWSPFWSTMGMVFVVERLVTVWGGWRARAPPIFRSLMYLGVPPGRATSAGWDWAANYKRRPWSRRQGVLLAVPGDPSFGIRWRSSTAGAAMVGRAQHHLVWDERCRLASRAVDPNAGEGVRARAPAPLGSTGGNSGMRPPSRHRGGSVDTRTTLLDARPRTPGRDLARAATTALGCTLLTAGDPGRVTARLTASGLAGDAARSSRRSPGGRRSGRRLGGPSHVLRWILADDERIRSG